MDEAKGKADSILYEAQQKAEQIIAAANVKADEIIGASAVKAQREQETLEKMQTAVTEFKSNLLSMYKAHLELITSLPESDSDESDEQEERRSSHAPVSAPAAEDMEATRVIDTASLQ
jgi:cell division initiation protein